MGESKKIKCKKCGAEIDFMDFLFNDMEINGEKKNGYEIFKEKFSDDKHV